MVLPTHEEQITFLIATNKVSGIDDFFFSRNPSQLQRIRTKTLLGQDRIIPIAMRNVNSTVNELPHFVGAASSTVFIDN